MIFVDIRDQIQRLQNELKQLYNESQLKQVREITFIHHKYLIRFPRLDIHYMLFVFMKEVQHWDIFGLMFIILIVKNGIDIMIMKVAIPIKK